MKEELERLYRSKRILMVARITKMVGCKAVAEDLVQTAFVKALASNSFDGRVKISTWFWVVLENVVIDYRKQVKPLVDVTFEELERIPSDEMNPEELLELKRYARKLEDVISELRPEIFQAFKRTEVEGERQIDVYREMKITKSTLLCAYQRLRKKLKGIER